MRLGLIYHQCKFKDIALTRLARWYDEVDKSGFLTFGRVARSIQTHYLDIISFFERRATNAAAESFNAKIKAFRAQFRRVRDRAFFLYRLAKLWLSGNFWLLSFKISYLCLPLFYETRTTPSCHPSGCAYRQL